MPSSSQRTTLQLEYQSVRPQTRIHNHRSGSCDWNTMHLFITLLSLFSLATAQFGFFDQMFGGHDGGHHHHHHHQQPQNNPSDASHYRAQVEKCKSAKKMSTRLKQEGTRHFSAKDPFQLTRVSSEQPSATNISAPTHSPAYTFRTTAPALGMPTRRSLSWEKGSVCASQGGGSSPVRRRARWSLSERGCYRSGDGGADER